MTSRRPHVLAIAALFALVMCPGVASSTQKSMTQRYAGVWTYTDAYHTNYLKITAATGGRMRLTTGFKYEGKISWVTAIEVVNSDAIYLRPSNGQLVGRFRSGNFRATHSAEIEYRIICAIAKNGTMRYRVKSEVGDEDYVATRIE